MKQVCQSYALSYIYFFIMVKHIILWKLREELSENEKATVKQNIKVGLEGLLGKVPGLLEIKVQIEGRLATSNCDLMLSCTLSDVEALKGYASNPHHVRVANEMVRPFTSVRTCLDFEM